MGRPPGNPDGMSKSTYIKARKVALKRKEKVLAAMAREDKFIPDNEMAAKALDAAVEILLLPGANSMRMSAAKVLLEFTQRKPATNSQVTLNAAEDFLDSIAPQ